jgi:DNA-binding MarR family transcriptional regulator
MKIPKKMSENILFILTQTTKASQLYIDKEMAAFGITRSQWTLLAHLYFVDNVNQKELADLMDIGKAALGKLAAKLETKGWIMRVADEIDGRAVRLSITDLAFPMVKKLVDLLFEESDRAITGLDKDDMASLRGLLNKMRLNMEEVPPSKRWLRLKSELVDEVVLLSGKT